MKKLLFLFLVLVPLLAFTQDTIVNPPPPPPPPPSDTIYDSWINIDLFTDEWPEETSWELLNEDSVIIASGGPYEDGLTLHSETIELNSGEYYYFIYDTWGDGLWQDGWVEIYNACEDLFYHEGPFGEYTYDEILESDSLGWMDSYATELVESLTIAPCAPPVLGCTDSTAINFNEEAFEDDNSCEYSQGCMNPNASNYNPLAGELPNGLIAPGGNCSFTSWNQNFFGIDSAEYYANTSLWEVGSRVYISGQQWFVDDVQFPGNCNAPAVLIYVVTTEAEADGNWLTYVPGLNVNAIVGEYWEVDPCVFIYGCTQPEALNYNPLAGVDDGSCINIPGCTDSTSVNYNPAATLDDNSCGNDGGPISCSPGKELVTVEIMLDQYAGEIGWDIYQGPNLIYEQPIGSYAGQPQGAIVTKYLCIDYGTTIQFTIDDSYGDGLGGAQFGGIDGTWVVYTACDTLSQGIGDFGTTYSELATVNECVQDAITGCTDPSYQEYNPMATIDDGSCTILNAFGCIDPNAFNYDSTATAQLQNPGCDNTLRLMDWADNGWAGSFLVVTQGNDWWGPFTLGPNDLVLDTIINFNTSEEIKTYFYSFGQSVPTSNQCRFQIINPVGLVISEGGTNSFTDPLLSYNQYGQIYDDMALCGNNCIPKIYGCLDENAVNYVATANTSDGSCYYNPGCTDAAYIEYYNYINDYGIEADFNNGTCEVYAIFGCTDPTAFNYNELATVNQVAVEDETNPCIPTIYGCTDPLAFNFNPNANTLEPGSCEPVINGCTDSTAFNYNENANTDNNSCIPVVEGCTDPDAFNYDPNANTDNGLCEDIIEGCTQPNQFNYNPLANTDDGSCYPIVYGCMNPNSYTYNDYDNDGVGNPLTGINGVDVNTNNNYCVPFIYGCLDSTAFNYNPDANTEDENNPCEPVVEGCMDPTMFNYDVNVNTDDGSCIPFAYGCTDPTAFNYDPNANTNVGCISFVYGCTDPDAFNYNPQANTDDGSCQEVIIGCTDNTALNYNALANTNSGCIYPILGCTDPTAFNYDVNANVDDNSCEPVIIGCTDNTALNYNSNANTNSGCIYAILGCTDPDAFNYDPIANTDNGSCIDVVIGCTDPTALNYNILANTNNGCVYPILGCTDPDAFNYNENANTDDGSCTPFIYGCTDNTMFNYDETANTDNGSCIEFIYGCIDPNAYNYDPFANTDNGTCEEFIYGCTDNIALNYNPLANTLDNSCCYIGGCTDSTALNYNEDACFDDGTCVVIIEGCADPNAYNFDPLVNLPDNTTCLYDAGCYGGPGEPYWLNDGCYAWVIDVDSYCCTDNWDVSCQSMYDYCEQGWPTSIEESGSGTIIVYPNPTNNILNIDTRLDIDIEIYNMMGKLIISEQKTNRIILNHIPNGIYNLVIKHDKLRITKKIIKQ